MTERKVYHLKCQIRAQADDVTRVDVYDDIGGGGWFSTGVSPSDIAAQLAGVKGALEVHINSGGGDVFDGIAIGNAISSHKGKVTTVIDGLAASIASVIAQAGQERVVQPGSMMMIHDAWGGCVGSADDMTQMAEVLNKNSDNIAKIYADRAGGKAADWRDTMRGEQWYTAEEAVEAGLADRVGDGAAELPEGIDVAAWTIPGRIAAALRKLPRAAAVHEPFDGSHSHTHSHDGDTHTHDHDHDGDASHDHDHDGYDDDADGQDKQNAADSRIRAIVRAELYAASEYGLYAAEKYKQADRDRMAKSGEAMPDGSYPIADEEDLDNAIRAVGRGGADHDTIRAHIIKRAKALGLSEKIPDNWNADGSLKTSDQTHTGFAWNPDQFRAGLERKGK